MVFRPNPGPELADEINDPVTSPGEQHIPGSTICKFSKNEVSQAIKDIHIKKAPGYDLITGKILKELPLESITYLTYLFNAIIRKGFFPLQWKVAQIKMILK